MGYSQLLLNLAVFDFKVILATLTHKIISYLACLHDRSSQIWTSPNLHQTCILGYSQLVFKMEVIDLDLQGHLGHFDSKF